MNPEAIMTPGGIADQLSNGLSGVAMAFQRAREQRERREQAEIENARSDSYLRIAQQNAQTGANNQQFNFARQGRLDQAQADSDVLGRHYNEQKAAREQEQFEMDQHKAALDTGFGAASGFSELAGMPNQSGQVGQLMPGDRFPVQNKAFRTRLSLAEQLSTDRGNAAMVTAEANLTRANATKQRVDRMYNSLRPADAIRAINADLSSRVDQMGGFAEEDREAVQSLRAKLAEFQGMPAGGMGAQAPLPKSKAPAWLDSLDVRTR